MIRFLKPLETNHYFIMIREEYIHAFHSENRPLLCPSIVSYSAMKKRDLCSRAGLHALTPRLIGHNSHHPSEQGLYITIGRFKMDTLDGDRGELLTRAMGG